MSVIVSCFGMVKYDSSRNDYEVKVKRDQLSRKVYVLCSGDLCCSGTSVGKPSSATLSAKHSERRLRGAWELRNISQRRLLRCHESLSLLSHRRLALIFVRVATPKHGLFKDSP